MSAGLLDHVEFIKLMLQELAGQLTSVETIRMG